LAFHCAQAKAPYALADLQERLVPTGIALKLNEEHRFAQDHKGRLTISNIKYSNIVEVLPLPMLEHGCERTPMRVRCVTIVRPCI
jgi:SWI/SNF-related matrix-associated actin-dependent regulator of chromatin subfamily A3